MKNFIKILIFGSLFCTLGVFAQSSTLLPSAIELPKFAVNPVCTATEKGRMIYNSTDNKSYYCNGTTWVDMSAGGLTLPFSGSGSVVAPNILFNVTNSANGRAITGETTSSTYGIGVYGSSTNTAPSSSSPSTIGVFGINNSTNSNGIGIYGQHDGNGKAIYGAVKNNGIGVHGISLPVASGGNGNGIGVKGESTGGRGVYGISSDGVGVYGVSTNNFGVRGSSVNYVGVSGYTDDYNAAYFQNTSNSYSTIYAVNFGTGKAGEFFGNVSISENLTVDNGLGIVRSENTTQLKIVRFSGGFALNGIGANGSLNTALNYPNFSGVPTVTVGQYENGTGDWQCFKIIPFDVTATGCSIKVMNGCSTTMTGAATIHFLIVGPK